MIKSRRLKYILVGLVILAGTDFAAGANQSRPANWEKGRQEWKIRRALSGKLVSWLSDANESAAVECDRLVDSLLTLPEPTIKAYFVAAQVARLREKPDKAITILEDVINNHPDEKAPIGIVLPVKIVARFWIGTIARHSGDITKAVNAYKEILEDLKNLEGLKGKEGLTMICNLYLAEIESKHLKRNDLALARLEAIERIKKPAGQLSAGYDIHDIYKGWAKYQHMRMSKGKDQAAQQLVEYQEMTAAAPLMAVTQLKLCGISQVIGYYRPQHLRAGIIDRALLDRFRNRISPIDWSLVTLVYGFGHQGEGQRAQKEGLHPKAQKHYLEAEKYYSALFDDDSFFSPVAGIYLAHIKKVQGKTVEADSILEQVRTKYPGYDSAVTKLKESWDKSTRKDAKND